LNDIATLRDTPELFEDGKVSEIGEHAARMIERALQSLGIVNPWRDDFDPFSFTQNPDYEDWRSRKHLPRDHPSPD